MEQQAKQRLTGGIILVALLVLLVPELLSGPATQQEQGPAAPGQAPLRSYTVDLNDGSQHGSAPVAASTQSVEPAPLPAQTEAANPASEPQPESAPEAATASAPQDSEPAPPAPVPGARTRAAHKKPPATAVIAAAAATAATVTAAVHPEPKPAPADKGGAWTVQVGLFSSRTNAQRLATTLEHKGFTVKVAEVGQEGRKRYRVRVGSAHDRAGARRLLARLKAAGQHDGSIVPP